MASRLFVVLTGLVVATTGLANLDVTEVRILRTGMFHGDEVDVASGETWFALVAGDDGDRLVRVTLRVTAVHDPIVDEDPRSTSGRDVQIDRDEVPTVLLRGDWSEGTVPSVDVEWSWKDPAVPLTMVLHGQVYEVVASWEGGGAPLGPEPLIDFRLSLRSNGRTQDLVAPPWCCDDAFPHVVWAGDLDRDGALDLLVEASNHYNVSTTVLFLSTAADEGSLVGKVAEFTSTGC